MEAYRVVFKEVGRSSRIAVSVEDQGMDSQLVMLEQVNQMVFLTGNQVDQLIKVLTKLQKGL